MSGELITLRSTMMLATLAEYKTLKNYLGTKDDTRHTFLLNYMSSLVKNYCRRTFIDFYDNNKTEYFKEGSPIHLTEHPIREIVSVTNKDDEDIEYVLDNNVLYGTFPTGIKAVKVIYKGGYENTESLPLDLRMAVLLLVEYYKEEHYVKRREMGDNLIEFFSAEKDFPAHIKLILNQYRV